MSEIIVPFGDLKLDYSHNKAQVDAAIAEVLASGWFILGGKLEEFEQAFARYCGAEFAVGVGSGTEALHLALLSCGVEPGDEVITVANTCVPTLSAITFAGAYPVLVDIDPKSYTMDPTKIEERISPKTKCIMPVNIYGQCADMEPICEIARRHSLKVVEDCAQAHGAKYGGRHAGAIGHSGCYSFYPSKNLGAYGDAGMVVTSDPDMAEYIRKARNYGQEKRYYHSIKGFNSRLDEMQAAILLAKLPGLDANNNRRREIAARYNFALASVNGITCPMEMAGRHHVYHLYVLQVKGRDSFQEFLKSRNVGTMIHYPVPIHRQQSYSECANQAVYLPVTDELSGQIVSLPVFPEMTDDQVEHVIESVRMWAGE
ncbi:MAG: DegT/DnrJ/EryC1/StrS family aminotransferase [Armatimonadetes bacterium]|nr:DegT/DnrJ/EryC1/StrS family aminotransferase [Armatimonadota bacterium]